MNGPAPRTGLVIVSHSARLAEGVVEVAAQMAPDVTLRAAGGTEDGGIGTSYALVDAAVDELLGTLDGAVVLTDLGSATMTAEAVLEALDDDAHRAVLAEGPIVEGAVAAAVAAQGGASTAEVAAAVADAARRFADLAGAAAGGGSGAPGADGGAAGAGGPAGEGVSRTLTLRNKVGLHARPAALLARLVTGFDAEVTINGVDARSVLALMGLGLEMGDAMDVRATGTGAAAAVDTVAAAVAEGFGEELG